MEIGPFALEDIIRSLAKPGRDPREDLPPPIFRRDIIKFEQLEPGMELRGTVLNVVDFGAFVDGGLADSGLVHISQLSNGYVRDPHEAVAVGDQVRTWVASIDQARRRVALPMIAPGTETPPEGRREVGDTRILHVPRTGEMTSGGERLVEVVVNGRVVAREVVPADADVHELAFDVEVERSSWIALRQFPQMHTNPVNVIVDGQPIRASRASAAWCAESVELLWTNRHQLIAEGEREAARAAYDRALETYQRIAGESPDDL